MEIVASSLGPTSGSGRRLQAHRLGGGLKVKTNVLGRRSLARTGGVFRVDELLRHGARTGWVRTH